MAHQWIGTWDKRGDVRSLVTSVYSSNVHVIKIESDSRYAWADQYDARAFAVLQEVVPKEEHSKLNKELIQKIFNSDKQHFVGVRFE